MYKVRHLCLEMLTSEQWIAAVAVHVYRLDNVECVFQGTNGGEALQLGAARDKQTAADTSAMSGGVNTGAATFAFIQACSTIHPCKSKRLSFSAVFKDNPAGTLRLYQGVSFLES